MRNLYTRGAGGLRLAAMVLLLLGAALGAGAQAPSWQVAVGASGTGASTVYALATDAGGNVFLAGEFAGTVTLGSSTLTSVGSQDVFVAKWSPATGQFAWAVAAGSADTDRPTAIAVNGTSVYVTGFFSGPTAAFGTATLTRFGTATGGSDGFVAKLTDAGSSAAFTWVQQMGGSGDDLLNALVLNGNTLYVAGLFVGATATFGPVVLSSSTTSTILVAKLVDAGPSASVAWTQQGGSNLVGLPRAMASSGPAVYVTGDFSGATCRFGSTVLTNADANTSDVFVAKLTDLGATGAWAWAERGGGLGSDVSWALAASGSSVYVGGEFVPSTTFGASTLVSAGNRDGLVAKLTDTGTAGNFVWAVRAGGPSLDVVRGLAAQGTSVYAVGNFNSTSATVGSFTLANADPVSGYAADGFVTRVVDAGATGSVAWATRLGGRASDYLSAVAIAGTRVYVGGAVVAPATFGALTLAGPVSYSPVGCLAALDDVVGLATATGTTLPGLAVVPSPAHGTARVVLPAGLSTPATLTVLDALGRTVRKQTVAAGASVALDLSGLPAGLYAVRVLGAGGSATARLVVD